MLYTLFVSFKPAEWKTKADCSVTVFVYEIARCSHQEQSLLSAIIIASVSSECCHPKTSTSVRCLWSLRKWSGENNVRRPEWAPEYKSEHSALNGFECLHNLTWRGQVTVLASIDLWRQSLKLRYVLYGWEKCELWPKCWFFIYLFFPPF